MAGPNNRGFATASTQIGICKEATIGTLPANPSYMIPVKSPKLKINQAMIPDETLQGVMAQVLDMVPGQRYDSHGWSAPPYLDSFPLLLQALLGSPDTKTAAGAATTVSVAAALGAATIHVTSATGISVGTYFTVGTAGSLETHYATNVASNIVTLNAPLSYAQPTGAPVTPLTMHQFSLLNNAGSAGNQPPSLSIWDNDGEEWRTLTAGQLDELSIKGNASGLVEYTVSFLCNPATPNASAPSTSFTTVETVAPWTFALLVGGSYSPTVMDWEYTFKRGTKIVPALTGTLEYLQYFAGPLQCTFKASFLEQSSSPYLTEYTNFTKQALDGTVFDVRSGFALNLHSTSTLITAGEVDRSKEWVEVPIEVQMLPSTADATAGSSSPVLATVANTITTTY